MKNWKKALLAALCFVMAGLPVMLAPAAVAAEETTDIGEAPVIEGFVKQNGKIYYYKKGKAVKGWQTIGSSKYYFGKDGAAYAAGSDRNVLVKKIGSYYYGFDKKGRMIAGKFCRVKIKKSGKTTVYRYYFTSSGKACAGKKSDLGDEIIALKKISGKRYGFLSNGRMALGIYISDSKFYYFDEKTGVYSAAQTKKLNAAAKYGKSTTKLKKLLGTVVKTVQTESCYADISVGKEYLIYYQNIVLDVFRYNSGKEIFLTALNR